MVRFCKNLTHLLIYKWYAQKIAYVIRKDRRTAGAIIITPENLEA